MSNSELTAEIPLNFTDSQLISYFESHMKDKSFQEISKKHFRDLIDEGTDPYYAMGLTCINEAILKDLS